MISRKKFFVALATAVALIGFANIGIARLSRNSVPRQVLGRVQHGHEYGVLGIGNSLMAAGFSQDDFDRELPQKRGWHRNLGLGSTGPVEHLLLTRHALSQAKSIDQIVYGFFERQLTIFEPSRNSQLIGNLALRYFQEPEIAAQYSGFSWLERCRFEMFRQAPMLTERATLWFKVEQFRRRLSEWGGPAAEVNEFGRVADFAQLLPGNSGDLRELLKQDTRDGLQFHPAVSRMILDARSKKVRLTFVSMPMTPEYVRKYYSTNEWKAYLTALEFKLKSQGVRFLDASNWVLDDSKYSDGLHLNAAGSQVFSRRLAEEVAIR